MHLNFRSLSEENPGAAWRRVFAHGWPGWSEWYRPRQTTNSPDIEASRKALRRYMPEYEGLWDELNTACGADEDGARFLSFWTPPRYLVNCSQAVVVDKDGPFLIRNYDLDPALNEATLLATKWRGRRVVGMVEAMAGLADGMNDAGLAASLTFGGRIVTQSGFGIPLIMRYILQMCSDVQEAIEALRALPSHMSYNITIIDKTGKWATVFLAPDRPAMVQHQPWATNHQLGVEWPKHGRVSNTLGRGRHLERLLNRPEINEPLLREEFRREPLYSMNYQEGFGTVYTSSYRPLSGEIVLSWKDGSQERWHIDDVGDREHPISYGEFGSYSAQTAVNGPIPAWYSAFLQHLPNHNLPPVEQARLAAFWRRNQQGAEEHWPNLNPISEIFPTIQED